MSTDMRSAMAEASRLTAAGRLDEATAVIQQALGGLPGSGMVREVHGVDSDHEPGFRPLEATPHPSAATRWGTSPLSGACSAERLLRRAPSIRARLPHVLQRPGGVRPFPLQPDAAAAEAGGQFIDASYANAAGARAYKLYVPRGYSGQAVPLIIMLHGGTQTAVDFAMGTRMNEFAERDTFLVAYPEQPTSANHSRCWNWFQAANQHRGAGEPSLVAGITQHVMSSYQVDADRVFMVGFSAGGAMAAVMAATYPDLYAAVGVHSGLAYGAAHDLPSAFAAMRGTAATRRPIGVTPLIVFHGDRDQTVHCVNADCLRDDWVQAVGDSQGSVNRSMREPTVVRGQSAAGLRYTRSLYSDASGGVAMEQWSIHGAGHSWSGGSHHGSYTDPQGPDATAEMVRFFNEHPKRPF